MHPPPPKPTAKLVRWAIELSIRKQQKKIAALQRQLLLTKTPETRDQIQADIECRRVTVEKLKDQRTGPAK